MKIVAYNVNGLRPHVSQHGSLLKLLNSLDADIICFQETKLSRQDLSVDLTFAEGYEGFLSCTRSNSRGRFAYSGVATFCRVESAFGSNEVALPVAAEEGFTGLLEVSKNREMVVGDFVVEFPLNVDGLEDVTSEDLVKVDSEGRCVITDHGHFVLFNLYGPRAEEDDKERLQFKFVFFKVLQKRWESLLNQGRRVIVVGDLNIAPAAIDRCDAEPGFEKNIAKCHRMLPKEKARERGPKMHISSKLRIHSMDIYQSKNSVVLINLSSRDYWTIYFFDRLMSKFRKWLRSLLRDSGGPFFDVFRSKHPERKEAYTCFSPRVGAEEFNYGSRIDHILIAGPCLHEEHGLEGHNFLNCHAEECDILSQFKRGTPESTPKWHGGRTVKLDGSDHVPVYAVLSSMPDISVHNTPPLALRYIPEVRGCQQTIVSLLRKRETSEAKDSGERILSPDCETTSSYETTAGISHFSLNQKPSNSVSETHCSASNSSDRSDVWKKNDNMMLPMTLKHHCGKKVMKKARHGTYSQLTLKSFFSQHKASNFMGDGSIDAPHIRDGEMFPETEASGDGSATENITANHSEFIMPVVNTSVQDPDNINSCRSCKMEKGSAAVLEWQKIQERMKTSIPLCRAHREPCVARSVKKGPNVGRRFYVCARPKGPESEPEANCNFFEWASMKSRQKRD